MGEEKAEPKLTLKFDKDSLDDCHAMIVAMALLEMQQDALAHAVNSLPI